MKIVNWFSTPPSQLIRTASLAGHQSRYRFPRRSGSTNPKLRRKYLLNFTSECLKVIDTHRAKLNDHSEWSPNGIPGSIRALSERSNVGPATSLPTVVKEHPHKSPHTRAREPVFQGG